MRTLEERQKKARTRLPFKGVVVGYDPGACAAMSAVLLDGKPRLIASMQVKDLVANGFSACGYLGQFMSRLEEHIGESGFVWVTEDFVGGRTAGIYSQVSLENRRAVYETAVQLSQRNCQGVYRVRPGTWHTLLGVVAPDFKQGAKAWALSNVHLNGVEPKDSCDVWDSICIASAAAIELGRGALIYAGKEILPPRVIKVPGL